MTKTGERPRFGKAMESSYVTLRRQQQVMLNKIPPNTVAAKRYGDAADDLERAINEWTGQQYPKDKWRWLSESERMALLDRSM